MELGTILSPGAIRPSVNVASKKRLFQTVADVAADAYGFEAAAVAEALCERESLGPTGVGRGVALPHARMDGMEGVSGAFLRLEEPIEFGAVDRRPVDLVFALFAPAGSGVDHLKALAAVSRVMRDRDVCAKLRANADPRVLHAILVDSRVDQAA